MKLLPKGVGRVATIRLWASEARREWGIDKAVWGRLPITERAEMICGIKLPVWLDSLEQHKQLEEIKNRG